MVILAYKMIFFEILDFIIRMLILFRMCLLIDLEGIVRSKERHRDRDLLSLFTTQKLHWWDGARPVPGHQHSF